MHASCQETFKHSIPPQKVIDVFHPPLPPPPKAPSDNGAETGESADGPAPTSNARINITFRFYRPDFRPSSIPKCKCGVPCILRPDMKNRYTVEAESEDEGKKGEEAEKTNKGLETKYWWTCYAGAQNDGKGCNFWKVMDVKAEGRGPFAGDIDST